MICAQGRLSPGTVIRSMAVLAVLLETVPYVDAAQESQTEREVSTVEVVRSAGASLVGIETPFRSGSGAVVDSSGVIATPRTQSDIPPDQAKGEEMLRSILEKSDIKYRKRDEGGWTADYVGTNSDVTVSVSALEGLTVIQSVVWKKPQLTPDLMTELMKLNYKRNLVKAGLNGDDLVVLHESEIALLDEVGLKRIVLEVALFSDDLAGMLHSAKPSTTVTSMVPSTTASSLTRPRHGRLDTLSLVPGRALLRFNSNRWRPKPVAEPNKTEFEHIDGDIYFAAIAERVEILPEKILDAMYRNAKEAMPDARVGQRGSRLINGISVQWIEIEMTNHGTPFAYLGHAYTGPAGTVQLIAIMGRNLMGRYRGAIEELVAGFEVVAK